MGANSREWGREVNLVVFRIFNGFKMKDNYGRLEMRLEMLTNASIPTLV